MNGTQSPPQNPTKPKDPGTTKPGTGGERVEQLVNKQLSVSNSRTIAFNISTTADRFGGSRFPAPLFSALLERAVSTDNFLYAQIVGTRRKLYLFDPIHRRSTKDYQGSLALSLDPAAVRLFFAGF